MLWPFYSHFIQYAHFAAHSSQPPVVAGCQHPACLCLAELSGGRSWPVGGFRHLNEIAFHSQFPLWTRVGICFLIMSLFRCKQEQDFFPQRYLYLLLGRLALLTSTTNLGIRCAGICSQVPCACVRAVETAAHVDTGLCHYDNSQEAS